MVRLLTPSGEGQHPIAPHCPEVLGARYDFTNQAYYACLLGGAWTGLQSFLGRAQPGTFLRATAIVSTINVSASILDRSIKRQCVIRPIYDYAGIEVKKGKLIERTVKATLDEWAVAGATLGILSALRAKSYNGVVGWARYVGAGSVGWTLGATAGIATLQTGELQSALAQYHEQQRRMEEECRRIQRDKSLNSKVPALGRVYLYTQRLKYWVSGHIPLLSQPLTLSSQTPSPSTSSHTHTFSIDAISLSGCDHNGSDRTYTWSPPNPASGIRSLQTHISTLKALELRYSTELEYIWQELARREQAYYRIPHDDPAKDTARRELQLLASLSLNLWLRRAMVDWHVADSWRYVKQLENAWPKKPWVPPQPNDLPMEEGWRERYKPEHSVEEIREWMEILKRRQEGLVEGLQDSRLVGKEKEEKQKEVDECGESLDAAQRLLKDFEEKIRKVDKSNGKGKKR